MTDYPLPWHVVQTSNEAPAYIIDLEGNQVARMQSTQFDVAKRIVACANACKGLSDTALAALPIGFFSTKISSRFNPDVTESEGGEA